jgi:outer membrane receptor protein involved in Fe transport
MNRILRSAIVLLMICLPGIAFAQNSGIKGNLKDERGNPIVNANVVVTEGGIQKGRDLTDFDGNYMIRPLNGGRYDVKFSYLGRDLTITGVVVAADQIITVNGKLTTTNEAIKGGKGVEVHAVRGYQAPIIDPENPGGRQVKTAEQIEKAPTRNTSDIAALSTQVYQGGSGGGLSIGGARSSGTKYVVDGVQLPPGASNFTNQAPGSVETITTFSSGIPARYGDASGGLVTITTKGATATTQGSVQYEHSIDGYNTNQLTLNLSGPLLRKKDSFGVRRPVVGYNLVADGIYAADNSPTYYKNSYINGDKLAELQEHPLTVIQENGITRTDYATNYVHDSSFYTSKRRKNADFYRGQLSGKLDFNINENVSVRVGASYFANQGTNFSRGGELFALDQFGETRSQTGRGYVRFTQKFGGKVGSDQLKDNQITNAFYTVQADYQKDYSTTQDKNKQHSTFDYGYVGKFEEQYTPIYAPGTDDSSGYVGVRLRGYAPSNVIFTPGTQNPLLTNYTKDAYSFYNEFGLHPRSQSDIQSVRGLRNGDGPPSVYGLFSNIGSTSTGWSKANDDQVSIGVDASFDLKHKKTTHSIEFGLYYQQRTERGYNISGAGTWNLMRQLTNRVVGQEVAKSPTFLHRDAAGVLHTYTIDSIKKGVFTPSPTDTIIYSRKIDYSAFSKYDLSLRNKLFAEGKIKNYWDYINTDLYDPSFYSLDMFSADDLLNSGNSYVGYYGYTYDGKLLTGNVNFNDFWTATNKLPTQDSAYTYYTRPIGAYRPNYIAGYLSDYIQYKDFRITLGVRVERFDNNTKVLVDPYSLYPERNVSDVKNTFHNVTIPDNIGNSYIVYVGSNPANPASVTPIGYRNGDTWYDASGKEVQDPQILKTATHSDRLEPLLQDPNQNIKDASFKPEQSFTDYKPQVNVMPRINFSFPLNENALFYAHYDVLYQRPSSGEAFATPTDYMFLDQRSSTVIGNTNLKPERMIDYEVGFQQRLSDRSGITISGFYKERKDQIQLRPYLYAYPITYYTYGNRDYSTYKGLSLAYELRRLGNLSLNINYTLSFTEGTGSSPTSSSAELAQFIASGQPGLRTQFPLPTDSRHNLNAQIDYRFAGDRRGPVIGNGHPFENAGIQIIFTARSGEPYTKYANAQNIQSGASNSSVIEGTVNGSRLPGHYNVDLNIDKTLPLRFHKAKEGETMRPSRLGLNIYAYARNVFNIRDIRSVYGYTGRADDAGFLTSALGAQTASNQADEAAFRNYYNIAQQNPGLVGPPRTIIVGLRLIF